MEHLVGKVDAQILDLIKALGVKLVGPDEYRADTGAGFDYKSQAGVYNSIVDVVCISPKVPDEWADIYPLGSVLLHETIHWTGRAGRLSRPAMMMAGMRFAGEDAYDPYSTEEATAQIGMVKLAKFLGIDYSACLAPYLLMFEGADLDEAERASDEAVEWIVKKAQLSPRNLPSSSACSAKCA